MFDTHMLRAALAAFTAAIMVTFTPGAGAASAYPDHPVTVIVPYAAGGNLDITTRAVTSAMGPLLKGSLVVDNRPGAGGLIGHEQALRSKADGYTLVTTANGSYAYAPRLVPDGKVFSDKDFAPVGFMAITPLVLEVPASSRFKSYQDFIAYARANPGKISIGHPGNGTTNHIAILQLQQATGAVFNIIPYKGSGPGVNDLLGKQLDAFMDQLPSSLPHLKANTLRPLAVTTGARAHDLPDTATLQELGLKGFDISTTTGLLAPAKTPAAVIAQLNAALNQALEEPEVRKRLAGLGSETRTGTPAQFAAYLKDENAKAAALAGKGLLKAD